MNENKGIMSSFNSTCSFPSITLADGSTSSFQGIEIANATLSLSLSFVLYVPKFSFNLLSVSKITRTLNCPVKLSPTFYKFQNLRTKKMIDTWDEKDGFKSVACYSLVSIIPVG